MQKNKEVRIVLILPGSMTSNWRRLEGVMQYVRAHSSWDVMTITNELTSALLLQIQQFRPHGIICGTGNDATLEPIVELGVPVVVVFRTNECFAASPNVRFVLCESRDIAIKASDFMIERGYRNFAYLGRSTATWDTERGDEFAKALRNRGFALERPSPETRSDELIARLRALPPHTAILAADDITAASTIALCSRHSIRIPQQLAILGVSNLALICENTHPPLSSIEQNLVYGGYLAATRLGSLLKGGIVPKVTRYKVGAVIDRGSLPPVASIPPLPLDRALDFINGHLSEPIEVPDVVKAVDISRRSLENLFKQHLSTTIASVIRARRLEFLARKIQESTLPLVHICLSCGWTNLPHVKRIFKRHFCQTMSEYRSSPTKQDKSHLARR